MTTQEIKKMSGDYNIYTWNKQRGYDPIVVEKADGVYYWDKDGTRWTDISSQLVCVNLGFNNQAGIKAIQDQAAQFAYVAPRHTYEKRAQLAKMIIDRAPKNMGKVMFTLGGADSNEYAIRFAMAYTGRNKVLSKYDSYHGSLWGSGSLTGQGHRAAPQPTAGFVKFPAPHMYTCNIRFETEEEYAAHFLWQLEATIRGEGPDKVAAIFLETVSGSNGCYIYPKGYLKGVRELCDKYGILMVCDEVMAGFGRTGTWFACQQFDVEPDIITCAKGINSGYAPLGGVIMSKKLAEFFDDHVIPGGLTYNAHALGVAAAIANIEEMERLNVMDNVAKMGKILGEGLEELKAKHPCVGDVRYIGLHSAIEFTKNREKRIPMLALDGGDIMHDVAPALKKRHMTTVGFDCNMMFCPALTVKEEELREMLAGIDDMLYEFDARVEE